MSSAHRLVVTCIALLLTIAKCHKAEMIQTEKQSLRDINEVLQDHAAELLELPEVVGFYVGQQQDGRACITVLLKSDDPEAKKNIPLTLEGHPVRIEVTGEFRPML